MKATLPRMKSAVGQFAFCLVDTQESVLDLSFVPLLNIVIEALVELSRCPKVQSVHKTTFDEAKEACVGASSLLRTYSGVHLTPMNNEPFGKRKTSGEGFGRKLLGLQCLHL